MHRILLLAFLVSSASAQTGPASAAWSGGGPAGDTGAAVATSEDGAVAVVGTFKETATFGSVSVTDPAAGCVFTSCHDGFVVVYAPDGSARWARRMGTPVHNDFAEDVAFAPDGSVYVSGYFTGISTWDGGSNPDIELTTRSNWDGFLAKYTADGDLLWVIQGGGADQDTGRGIAVDGDGNVYWTGYFYGTATFGEGTEAVTFTSDGSSDGFVAKVRPDGTQAWAVQLGGLAGADFYDAAVYPYATSDAVFLVGTFAGVATLGTTALQSRGDDDLIVAALESDDGSVRWMEQIGGAGDDHGRGIEVGETGHVAVAGWFREQILIGSDVLTSAGLSDALLAVLDYDGAPQWGRRAGGSGFDIGEDVALVDFPIPVRGIGPSAPVVLLTGYVEGDVTVGSPEGDVPLSAQSRDGLVAVYDLSERDLLGAYLQGGASQDASYGIAVTPSYAAPPSHPDFRSIYAVATGTFNGTAAVFEEDITSSGSSDVFVGKLGTCPAFYCLSTDSDAGPDPVGLTLTVAPHPATESSRLGVAMDEPGDLHVTLVDLVGREVAQLALGPHAAGEHSFSVPRVSPGLYLLRAVTEAGTVARPLVIAR